MKKWNSLAKYGVSIIFCFSRVHTAGDIVIWHLEILE